MVAVAGCTVYDFQKLERREWRLVWGDEFDGAPGESPDPQKWAFDIGRGQDGWGNQELQYYTNRPQNVSMDGEGNLVITALNDNFAGAPFSSARIKTEGLFTQKYGRFEARLRALIQNFMSMPLSGMPTKLIFLWTTLRINGSNARRLPAPGCMISHSLSC
mgnify:CR=1 FL=1